jgi:ubiquitin-activating enzyme E1
MRGVGVETAKNLILSNVGAVVICDSNLTRLPDMGTNFYLTEDDVGTVTRAQACLPHLQSLNPYCKVHVLEDWSDKELLNSNVLQTQKPYSAVVVTDIIPNLYQVNEICRRQGIAFVLAVTKGITTSLFSDFGHHHEITDPLGEPMQTLALSNMEVFTEVPSLLQIDGVTKGPVVMLTVAQSQHGLDTGDVVQLEDMRDALSILNGKELRIHRVALKSPTEAGINAQSVSFTEALKLPTSVLCDNFEKQYQYYWKEFQATAQSENAKFPVRTITLLNRLAIVLGEDIDVSLLQTYQAGGLLNQIRQPIVVSYNSLEQTMIQTPVPQMLRGEDWEAGKGVELHLCTAAVLDFHTIRDHWPRLHSEEDADLMVDLVKDLSQQRQSIEGSCWAQEVSFGFPSGTSRELDLDRVRRYAKLFEAELTGFCAFLGGAAAQEVLKKTGKFTPINQWIHHDEDNLVTDQTVTNIQPLFGSRYDYQIAILGKDFQARAANQRVFLVGCGALGCEYLKGLALMGVGTGRDGEIIVTDMDRIEVSNLSRQFLFRDKDVGHSKSVSGARVVKSWNPKLNIVALEKRVGTDSEDYFDDHFWESLDVCWNALDNVLARKYTDSQCLFYSKPLLESGTLGTKCNHEVILPYRTSTYNDGKESDENENQIAMCTLRSFPYLPLHCIEFAKQAYFADYFEFGPDQYETFRKDMESFFEQLDSMDAGEQIKSLKAIDHFISLQKDGRKIDFDACVRMAFDRMIQDFRTSILNIVFAADEMEKAQGNQFWTGTKRRPRAIEWGSGDLSTVAPELLEYLYCSSNMYAVVWGLEPVRDRSEFEHVVGALKLKQPDWSPNKDSVDLSETDEGEDGGDEGEQVEKLKTDLYSVDVSTLQPATAHDFEKDDDSNFHIDFLTIATNLRSWNYDIKVSQRHTVKVTAGRIIPALATTTAMVCGLVDIEFCKLVMGLQCMGKDRFLNSNINLAAGSGNFTTYAPDPPVQLKTNLGAPHPEFYSSWDKVEIASGSIGQEHSVKQLVDYIEKTFGVNINRLFGFGSTQDKAIYSAVDKQKLDWEINFDKDDKPVVSEGVFTQWPQTRMAVQMLERLPPASGQRKAFEQQLRNVKTALDKAKETFDAHFHGPVSVAYRETYRPEEDGSPEQEYFDAVFGTRDYIKLAVDCHEDGHDIHLPCIKYVYTHERTYEEEEEKAQKRLRLAN